MKRLALLYVVGLVVAVAGCEAGEPGVADDVASTASAVTSVDVSGGDADMRAQFWHYCAEACTNEYGCIHGSCDSRALAACAEGCDIFYPGNPNLAADAPSSDLIADECAQACSEEVPGIGACGVTPVHDCIAVHETVYRGCLNTCRRMFCPDRWSPSCHIPELAMASPTAPEDGDGLGWTPVGSCLRGCTAERDAADQGCTPSALIGTNMSQADCHNLHAQDNEMCRSSCKLILGGCIDWPVCGSGSL